MTWPTHFPDSCPPSDSDGTDGYVIYLLVPETPPTDTDLLSRRQKNLNKPPYSPVEKECRACGRSTTINRAELETLRRAFPNNYRDHIAVSVTLHDKAGRIKHTPFDASPQHHTWWVADDFAFGDSWRECAQ